MVFKSFSLESSIKYCCIFEQRIEKKITFSMLKHTWYIFETNVTLQKNRFQKLFAFRKRYFHLIYTMWNLKTNAQ
jgi:hypothetical protein